jgi:hypothetical protein
MHRLRRIAADREWLESLDRKHQTHRNAPWLAGLALIEGDAMKSDAIVSNVIYLKPRISISDLAIETALRVMLAVGMYAAMVAFAALCLSPFIGAAYFISNHITVSFN